MPIAIPKPWTFTSPKTVSHNVYRPVNKITVQGVIYCMKYFFVLFLLLAAPAHALDHLQVVKTATRSHIKISLPRSLRPVLICQADDDDGDDDQLDVQVAYRRPDLIETIAKAAIAVGADGIFIETHPDPANAKSDGANMLPLAQLDSLLEKLVRIRKAVY